MTHTKPIRQPCKQCGERYVQRGCDGMCRGCYVRRDQLQTMTRRAQIAKK